MYARSFSTLALLMLISQQALLAQPYLEGNTRHRFAQLTLGADLTWHPGTGHTAFLNEQSQLQTVDLPNQVGADFWISGLHFWGHADFAVRFPLAQLRLGRTDGLKTTFLPGIETIAKVYPWRIESGKVRPFVGFSVRQLEFDQAVGQAATVQGPQEQRVVTPLLTGFTYLRSQGLWELGLSWNQQREMHYAVSRTQTEPIRVPGPQLSIGYRRMLETTLGAEKNWQSGRTAERTRELAAQGKLNRWFVGVGPSSAWFLGSIDYLQAERPHLGPPEAGVLWDLVAGRYWHKPDLNVNLAFRRVGSQTSGYDFDFRTRRTALTLETTKYLGDYHGFAPFVGPAVSLENLSFEEEDAGELINERSWLGLQAGITAGWDIRPNRLQSFYLRTNVRWFPTLGMDTEAGTRLPFQQLEVNFIQAVWML